MTSVPNYGFLVDDIVGSVNFYIEDRTNPPEEEADEARDLFDPKVAFKSATGVRALESEVLRSSRRQARREADFLFDIPPVR